MSDDPIDDYLWDRSGEADEELTKLEELLGCYRVDHAVRPVDAIDADEDDPAGG
jgi:hypothetical protein